MSKKTTRAGRQADTTTPQVVLPQGKNYLFAIGIDMYLYQPRLYNAVKDAQDVVNVLTNRYQFADDEEQIIQLYNEKATQGGIINKLKELSRMITDQDNLMIYFSGHGEFDEVFDVGFWIPYDGEPGNIGSYISFDLITKSLKAIKSFHTFVVADSCYSGSFFTERRAAGDVKSYLESIPSRWLLTAGRNEVVADGKPGDNSPFADAILWRLKNNNEERLRVSDFCNYVIVDVGNNAQQVPRAAPLHGVGDRGGEFMFRLKEVANKVYEDNLIVKPEGTDRGGSNVRNNEPDTPQEAVKEVFASIEDLRAVLKRYLADSEFEKAFHLYNKSVNGSSSMANTLISLQGQYNGMKKQKLQGLVGDDFATRIFNRIRVALTEMADSLEDSDLKADFLQKKIIDSTPQPSQLTPLERQGLESQLNILQKKLNYFLQQQAVISDPSQKFTLEMQIQEAQQQVDEAKAKLGIQ